MRVDEGLDEQRVQGCLNILCDIGGFGDIECEVLEPGHVVLAFNTSSAMRNPYGDLHGGFYMTVSDMAACMAVCTNASKPVTLQCNLREKGACWGRAVSYAGGIPRNRAHVFRRGRQGDALEAAARYGSVFRRASLLTSLLRC